MADKIPIKAEYSEGLPVALAEFETGDTLPVAVLPTVTTVGNPGSDSSIPTERAVREAITTGNGFDPAAPGAIGGTTPAAGTFTTLKITQGSPGAGKVLTSDADGDATWETPSVPDLASPGSIGETTPGTIRGLNKELVFASTDTLDANECAGTIINNYGQSNDATITLPAAASGMSFTVILGTTVAKYYRLDPNASDSIYLNGITTGDGKYVGIASAVLGATISFVAFKTGASTYDWYAGTIFGLWAAEA